MLHRDLEIAHPETPQLCAMLDCKRWYSVSREPLVGSTALKCYWNVEEQTRTCGGEIVFGWLLYEVVGLFVVGWHHAIWRALDGQLVDISPHPITGYASGRTSFAEDPDQTYDISWPLGKPQVMLPLMEHPLLFDFARLQNDIDVTNRMILENQKNIPNTKFVHVGSAGRVEASDIDGKDKLQQIADRYYPTVQLLSSRRVKLLQSLEFLQSVVLDSVTR